MIGLQRWVETLVRGRRTAIVGVGSRLRGDDGAGPAVVERLAGSRACVIDAGTVPENYLGVLAQAAPEVVLFVDSLDHGAAPGACGVAPPAALGSRGADTHAPSLRLLTGLLESAGSECWLLGIQPARCDLGEGLSPEVAAAVDALAGALAAALSPEVCHA